VVVFSATGTTKGVAEKIAAIEDADLYEIVPAEPYSDGDLNWNDRNSRTTKEQNDKNVRPGIASETVDLSGYERIYVGYPIWWGEEPRILDTFVESYDFGSAVMIPFCTSASSGIGRSGKNLAEHATGGSWLDGKRFSGSVSESDLANWINGLK
jgi:flavodoxin